MNFHRTMLAGCTVAALVGCSTWSPQAPGYVVTSGGNVKDAHAAATDAQGGAFNKALSEQYASYSAQLYGSSDYVDADYYSRKGQATAKGLPTPPEDNARWAIAREDPAHTRSTLAAARESLVGALDGGAGTRKPVVAAQAQKGYDCWVTDTQRDWRNINKSPCRADFQTAMAGLMATIEPAAAPPPPPTLHLRVMFGTDKYDLSPDAKQVIAGAAEAARGNPATRVTVVGKTDTVGTASYNLALSQRRAQAVRSGLLAAGVPVGQIDESYTGQEHLNVPTPDETPEAANRTVNIEVH
jgi:OOP family OmpA-OmpF porin